MKKLLPLLMALATFPLFQSCVGPQQFGPGFGPGFGGANNFGASVGIVATNHPRWGYDPFVRSFYDFGVGQYWNLNQRSYFTNVPRRFNTPLFPQNFVRGRALNCPVGLPHLNTSFRRPSVGFVSTANNRWAYDPYRRSYFDHQTRRFFNTNTGSYFNNLPRRHSTPRFPNGYRSGGRAPLHSSLPYVSNRTNASQSRNQRSTFQRGRTQVPNASSRSFRSQSSSSRQPSIQQQRSLRPDLSRSIGSSRSTRSQSRFTPSSQISQRSRSSSEAMRRAVQQQQQSRSTRSSRSSQAQSQARAQAQARGQMQARAQSQAQAESRSRAAQSAARAANAKRAQSSFGGSRSGASPSNRSKPTMRSSQYRSPSSSSRSSRGGSSSRGSSRGGSRGGRQIY